MNNKILALIGITLFFLVVSVLYFVIFINETYEKILGIFMPFIIFSGFFIFLIAAFLVAMSIFNAISK